MAGLILHITPGAVSVHTSNAKTRGIDMVNINFTDGSVRVGSNLFAIIRKTTADKIGRLRKSGSEADIEVKPFAVCEIKINDESNYLDDFGTCVKILLSGPATDGSLLYLGPLDTGDVFDTLLGATAECEKRRARCMTTH